MWVRFLGLLSLSSSIWITNLTALAQAKEPKRIEQLEHFDSGTCTTKLAQAINSVVNRPEFSRSRWGIEIQSQESNDSLYSLNEDKFFTPASGLKLLTTAAVLLEFGGDYRLSTPVYISGNPPNLDSLRIKGQGDPSFSTQDLKAIVRKLKVLGVEQITELITEDSSFESPSINPTWEWLDVHSYFATAVNSTILNQNTVTLTLLPQQIGEPVKFHWSDEIAAKQWNLANQGLTGAPDIPYDIEIDGELGKPTLFIRGELAANASPDIWDLAIVEPGQYFLESLRLHLSQAGIQVKKGTVLNQPPSDPEISTELKIIKSPSISHLIGTVNKESNNLHAEALGKILANRLNKDTFEAIRDTLTKRGLSQKDYVLADASGLSRQNLATPKTLVKILKLMIDPSGFADNRKDDQHIYRHSLATPGEQGTLRTRFRNQLLASKLWGKTGTLTGVGTLSGYLVRSQDQTIVFSILLNNSELSNQQIRNAIDEVIVIIDRNLSCYKSRTRT